MLRFFASRLLQSLLALIIIITATFFMLRFVPGGPFTSEKAVTPEILRNLEAHYGLDQPLWKQYFDYLGSLAQGDFGPSFKYPNRTVNEILADKLPVSLELGFLSLLVALLIGLPLGILAAVRRNTWVDYVRHSLKGGLLPVVSFLGPAIAGILTGSFVIETIFQIPGIGREFVNSAFNRDYTLVLGTVILYAVLIMALNLAADVVQAWMNPKVRLEA